MVAASTTVAKCALCSAESVHGRESLPAVWEEYLREKRGAVFFGTTVVPLCKDCYPVYRILRSGTSTPASPEEGSKVVEMLDEVRLEEIEAKIAIT